MCGRYTNRGIASDIERRFGIEDVPQRATGRFNVAPGQQMLGIVSDGVGRQAELLRWGLAPAWESSGSSHRLINARAESVREKRSFTDLVASHAHRALIVADGFYEWLVPEDRKAARSPIHFSLATERPFAFAALWTRCRTPDGALVSSAAIVTTTANEIVAPVHDRMPVILTDPEAEQAWLDPSVDGEAAFELLRPLPAFLMRARTASPLVNSARNEGPQLLDEQLRLAA